MTIAEIAQKFDLSTDTLRYYEKIGLLSHIHRTAGVIRDYTEENCRWVEFIKCMRSSGLSIEFLPKYITLFEQGDATILERNPCWSNNAIY